MKRWIAYFPPELLEEVDAWAKAKGISKRADAMRQLLRQALDEDKARRPGKGKPFTAAELEIVKAIVVEAGGVERQAALNTALRVLKNVNNGDA